MFNYDVTNLFKFVKQMFISSKLIRKGESAKNYTWKIVHSEPAKLNKNVIKCIFKIILGIVHFVEVSEGCKGVYG